MNEDRMMQFFFEIHSNLPREGPGDRESTGTALSMLKDLNKNPHILDIGCGPGMQTLDIADFTTGSIIAVDMHQPFLDQLSERATQKGIANRIQIMNADMASLDFEPATFDLIWSEGAAYIMGFENALNSWKRILKKPGYLAVTEISWIKSNPPEEVQHFFDEEYPVMNDVESNVEVIQNAGYEMIGNFILPKSAWWDNYYTPIETKLPAFRDKYKTDPEALAVAELHEVEIDMYRKYSDFYGYVFYVMKVC